MKWISDNYLVLIGAVLCVALIASEIIGRHK